MERIVVFCPNLVGDTAMATPTLRSLRQGFPNARIVGVIKPTIAATLDGNPWLDDLILHQPKSKKPNEDSRALIKRLRSEQFDLAVLLPNSFRTAFLAWRGQVKRRIGYARGGRGLLLTDKLQPLRDREGYVPTPIVGYYLAIAKRLGCPTDAFRLELFTTQADEQAADSAWKSLGIQPNEKVVCLNTGGAFGPAKNWPIEYFAELARSLAEQDGHTILAICGPSEREIVETIVRQANHPKVHGLFNQPLSIGLSKACVKRSALLITTDSGPRHFAAGFNVPVLSLFGPTHIAWTRTQHPQALHLLHPVPCGPCQKPICPLKHHRCMTELRPDSVLNAARKMLA